jgi:probable HAF family extracellular repeat protein
VTGYAQTATGTYHAFLYTGHQMTDLGTLGDGENASSGTGINNMGQVVGTVDFATGDSHAFLYYDGQMTDLGTFPATPPVTATA